MVTGFQLDQELVLLETQSGPPRDYHDPFVVFLVVPEVRFGSVTSRDDALDPQIIALVQDLRQLIGDPLWKAGE